MNIGLNLNSYNINFKANTQNTKAKKPNFCAKPNIRETGFDIFQKITAHFDAIEKPIEIPKYLVECYNEAFDEVMAQNPIVKEMNYKKPELIYGDEDKEGTIASYDIYTNTITVSPYTNNDLYIVYSKCNKHLAGISDTINSEEKAKKIAEKLRKVSSNARIIKLNEAEKKTVIKSFFAHELRHSIQVNLILSTEGCTEEFKKSCFNDLDEMQKDIDKLISLRKKLYLLSKNNKKYNISNLLKEKAGLEYMKNYVPKKIFDSNKRLKFSRLKGNTHELSVKEHLLKGVCNANAKDKEVYRANPVELDAYHYQYEYLLSQKNPKSRKEVMEAIITKKLCDIYDIKQAMLEAGYPPIYGKEAN